MVPIVLDGQKTAIAVVGEGPRALARLRWLASHGCSPAAVFAPAPTAELATEAHKALRRWWPEERDLTDIHIVFAADLSPERIAALGRTARAAKALLNTEDVTAHCDFHVPGTVRRGHLMLTVSTDGRVPALSRRLAAHLGAAFGDEWADRVAELAAARGRWRAEGVDGPAISGRTDALIAEKGWLS